MTQACHICNHGESFHDRWGICGVRECKPCYQEMACPRCKHVMFDHSVFIDRSKVMCTHNDCSLLVCYNSAHPERATPLHMGGNVIPMVPRRMQPTYEESLTHPLAPQNRPYVHALPQASTSNTPAVEDDPLIEPGLWKEYKPGRRYESDRRGYVQIDYEEKNERGAFKHPAPGRVWETRVSGYVEDVPPGPPEKGFLD